MNKSTPPEPHPEHGSEIKRWTAKRKAAVVLDLIKDRPRLQRLPASMSGGLRYALTGFTNAQDNGLNVLYWWDWLGLWIRVDPSGDCGSFPYEAVPDGRADRRDTAARTVSSSV